MSDLSDFITMQCPNCGGKLAVGANALSLKCEHCGAEHMIRREAGGIVLESYARCPLCNRNDKAEKASAILRSQTQNSQGITYQTRTTMVPIGNTVVPVNQQIAVPVQTSQVSELAKHLAPPSQPQLNKGVAIKDGTSNLAIISASLLAVVGSLLALCVTLTSSVFLRGDILTILLCSATSFIPLLISVLLFIFVIPRERRSNREKKP
jgi:predicted RNA-binding Zn-ribbon protein involved in translation (DUF1610 family)